MSEPLSRFTPSVMPAETLEAIFVARGQILDSIMQRVEASADTDTRNQTLLVGPRGAGKTHLIALTYHRTKALIAAGRELQLAWLPEDPWTIASYRHLLAAIAERLEGDPPLDRRGSVPELEARLVARAQERGTIVVLAENLDRVLNQLGEDGQQQFRHFLQHECRMLVIATTTTLDRNLADQARPFYGFFTTTRLKPFTPEQGRDMLTAIADYAGDKDLEEFLGTDVALSRVKAIAHLAGGQPRLWALLSSSLRADELKTLVDLLLTRFDDLTPYYQEQLGSLSPQQRLIVAELAEADHPLHVGALAERLEIEQRSVAKAISDLVERGWLAPVNTEFADLLDRRRTYYELAEPMARLSFQIKDSRGEPLRLVVDFLKAWFDPKDLDGLGEGNGVESYLEVVQHEFGSDSVGCAVRRLTSLPITRAPALALLGRMDDALAAASRGDASEVMELPTTLRAVVEERLADKADRSVALLKVRRSLHYAALDEVGDVPTRATADWVARAERLVTDDPDNPLTRSILVRWLSQAWRFEEAEAAVNAFAADLGGETRSFSVARTYLAGALQSAGRLARAIPLYEVDLAESERLFGSDDPDTLTSRERVLGPDHPDTLASRNNLASAHWLAGRRGESLEMLGSAAAIALRLFGPDHEVTRRLIENRDAARQLMAEQPNTDVDSQR